MKEFKANEFVVFVTKKGVIKKTEMMQYANPRPSGIIALGIDEGDELVSVRITDGTKHLLLSSKEGMSIRFEESEVRPMGRAAYGVKGMTLEGADELVSAEVVEPGKTLLTVTANGYGKRTEEAEYRIQGRGGKGIIDIKTSDRNGSVIGAAQVSEDDEIMLITNKGMLIRTRAKDVSVIGRNTQGVRLISLEAEDEKVVSVTRLPESSATEAPEPEASA